MTAYSPLGSPDSATMMNRPDDTPSVMVRCHLLACSCAAPYPAAPACEPCQARARMLQFTWASAQHDETVKSVAEKLGKNPAAVLVRWAIQHGTSGEHTLRTP